jgi:hypothetical protein
LAGLGRGHDDDGVGLLVEGHRDLAYPGADGRILAQLLQGPHERHGGNVLEAKNDGPRSVVSRRVGRAVGGSHAARGLDALAFEGLAALGLLVPALLGNAALALLGLLEPALLGHAALVLHFLAPEVLAVFAFGGLLAGGFGPGAPRGPALLGLPPFLLIQRTRLRGRQSRQPERRRHDQSRRQPLP